MPDDPNTAFLKSQWAGLPDGNEIVLPDGTTTFGATAPVVSKPLDRLTEVMTAKLNSIGLKTTSKIPKRTSEPKTQKVYKKVTLKSQARDRLIVRAIRAALESGIPHSDPCLVYKGYSLLTHDAKEQFLHASDELNYLPSLKATNWERTSDHLKQVYYNLALSHSQDIIAFTLNLSRERSQEARKTGAAKHLQERLARQFKRSLASDDSHLPFWFSLEINQNGILHLHGAMPKGANSKDKIRSALEVAGGPYSDSDSSRPVTFKNAYEPHGWFLYSTKEDTWTAAQIDGPTYACTRSIQATARRLYARDRLLINNRDNKS